MKRWKKVVLPGLEPGTFSTSKRRDNRYTIRPSYPCYYYICPYNTLPHYNQRLTCLLIRVPIPTNIYSTLYNQSNQSTTAPILTTPLQNINTCANNHVCVMVVGSNGANYDTIGDSSIPVDPSESWGTHEYLCSGCCPINTGCSSQRHHAYTIQD